MKSIYQKVLVLGAAISSLIVNQPAIAEKVGETLIHLGTTREGEMIFLDTEKVKDSRFAIVMSYGNGMKYWYYDASCAEKRLFRRRTETFAASGIKIDTNRKREEIEYKTTTAAGMGMKYACQKINALGW